MPFAAKLILSVGAVLTAASLVLALVAWLVLCLLRRPPGRFWKPIFRLHLWLVPIYLLLGPPALMTSFAAVMVGTRGDERSYAGPRVSTVGAWSIQDRHGTLGPERRGERPVDEEVLARSRALSVAFEADDGVSLNGYFVPSLESPPRLAVVLVHGLFRNAMELETAASMFHDLGAEVLLLELRNHGKSGRANATFGRDESDDVLAATRFLRSRSRQETPLVLYGVSLGAAAVALAAPRVERLGGIVLDAPMTSLEETANNLMREGIGLFEPYCSLSLFGLQVVNHFDLDDVRPEQSVRALPDDLPALVIGGSDDFRTPPEMVTQVYQALPQEGGVKELWILDGARHAKVWQVDPSGYRMRLERLVDRVVARFRSGARGR